MSLHVLAVLSALIIPSVESRSVLQAPVYGGYGGPSYGCPPYDESDLFNFGAVRDLGQGYGVLQEPLPVPDNARGLAVDFGKGYAVEKMGGGAYFVTDGIYTTMFAVTNEGVVYFDAPPQTGANMLAAVAEVTDKPVTHVVLSHAHFDHIGAATQVFGDNVTYITSASIAEKLNSLANPTAPQPDIVFEGNETTLEIGGVTMELYSVPLVHSFHDMMAWLPEQKVLMVVDVIFPGWVPWRSFALAKDLGMYAEAHDLILDFDFEYLVAGHVNRWGTPEDVTTAKEFFGDVKQATIVALSEIPEIQQTVAAQVDGYEDNNWLFGDLFQRSIFERCYEQVVPKWAERLGGVDVFTRTHCQEMYVYLYIDYHL